MGRVYLESTVFVKKKKSIPTTCPAGNTIYFHVPTTASSQDSAPSGARVFKAYALYNDSAPAGADYLANYANAPAGA